MDSTDVEPTEELTTRNSESYVPLESSVSAPQQVAKEMLDECTCDSDCKPGDSNINCVIHGTNPDYRNRDENDETDLSIIDVGAETIGAIKEYHGHKRFDINKHVARPDEFDVEDEVMRTAINGVLHMASTPEQRRKMKEMADALPDHKPANHTTQLIQPILREVKKNKRVSSERLKFEPSLQLDQLSASKKIKIPIQARHVAKPVAKPPVASSPPLPKLFHVSNKWDQCVDNPEGKCLCRLPRPKPERVPSHRLRAKSLRTPPDTISMPLQPTPLGYRWSYRRFAPDNDKHKLVDHRHYITPPFKWVLVPTDLSIKRKKSFDYMKEAKYGYRNQMDGDDLSVVNPYNFPPYCYSIIEPLRFPYQNFNAPPFPKRAPLDFIHGKFKDKVDTNNDKPRIKMFKEGDVKLTRRDVRRLTDQQLGKKRNQFDTDDDAWAGYKPKFIKSPVSHVWKYNYQQTEPPPPKKRRPRRSTKYGENESKPVVKSQKQLLKGASAW